MRKESDAVFLKRIEEHLKSPQVQKAMDEAIKGTLRDIELIKQETEVDWRKLDEPITI